MRRNGGGQIHLLDRGRVMADYGPMRLLISAAVGRVAQVQECVRAAKAAFCYLDEVASNLDRIGRPWPRVSKTIQNRIVLSMFRASSAVGDEDLTPMAAVAGAIADAVANFLVERGMTKVVVSNGGDIAVRLGNGDSVRVGIGAGGAMDGQTMTLVLDSSKSSWGVASSGLGGRSLTKGIASIVTVVSTTAAYADAAATAIANATFVADPQVKQVPAEQINPNTDIPGQMITLKVGDIGYQKQVLALEQGREKAQELIEKGLISGALVVVCNRMEMVGMLKDFNQHNEVCVH